MHTPICTLYTLIYTLIYTLTYTLIYTPPHTPTNSPSRLQAWGSFNFALPAGRYPNLIYDLHVYYAFNMPEGGSRSGVVVVT